MQFEQRLTHALHLSGAADVLPEEGVQAISIDPLTTPPPTQPTSPRLPSTQSLPSSPQIGSGSNRQGGQRSNSIATTTTEISGQSSRDYGSHPSSPGTSPPSSSTGSRAQPRTHSAPYKHEVLISTSTKPSYSLAGVSSSHVTNLIDLETPDMTNIELLAAMDEAKDLMFQTRKNRPTNPTYPPLRTVNKKHRVQVSSKLGAEFMEQAGEGRSICPDGFITAKDWLRTATWWLLKVLDSITTDV